MPVKKTPEPVYIFAGEETLLMEEQISRIKKSMGEEALMNFSSFNAEQIQDINRVIEQINTLPFLSERKCLIIKRVNKLKAKPLSKIIEYTKTPCRSTVLVLTIEAPPKDKVANAALNKFPKTVEVRRFNPMKTVVLTSWLEKKAGEMGKEIRKDASFLLADLTDRNTALMAQEIKKLCIYIQEDRVIEKKHVKELVVPGHESSIFNLSDSLFARNKQALGLVLELEQSGIEPMQIIGLLENQALWHLHCLFGSGHSKNIRPFVVKKIKAHKPKWTQAELENLLKGLREIETGIKTGRTQHPFASMAETIGRFVLKPG